MKKGFLIGTDIGTSSAKTVITDFTGNVVSQAAAAYEVLKPFPAWAQQHPDIWLKAVKDTIKAAVQAGGIEGRDVASVCISGLYGGSGVPLDKNMEVVRPCIIWMDRRSSELCEKLRSNVDEKRLFEITENGIDSYFGYTKILWMKKHEPELWKQTELFLPPNQYILYRLTGEIAMDHTAAGNLGGIYWMEKGEWSREMSRMLGIPLEKMPEKLLRPYERAGYLTGEAARELGLSEGTPVCAGCVDCLASTLAAGAASRGQSVAVLATSLNWGMLHQDRSRNPKYITMPYVTDERQLRYTYGGMSTAGALTKWFSEKFMPGEELPFEALEEGAARIPPGSEGLLLLPYFMGERCPVWDDKARGMLLGLTLNHGPFHIYRGILESTGYGMKHMMEDSGFVPGTTGGCRLVGGGSSSDLWTQILADITGVPMERIREGIEAPYGSAFLAGYSAGIYKSFREIEKWNHQEDVFMPDGRNFIIYQEYFEIFKDMYYSIKEDMHRLAQLSLKK